MIDDYSIDAADIIMIEVKIKTFEIELLRLRNLPEGETDEMHVFCNIATRIKNLSSLIVQLKEDVKFHRRKLSF
jgi:hypothetical protein